MGRSTADPKFIYAYCRDCKTPLFFIGHTSKLKPIMQCSICKEKHTVPKEWVEGLDIHPEFGLTEEEKVARENLKYIRSLPERANRSTHTVVQRGRKKK